MRWMRAAPLAALLLTGCFSYVEELWLERDGSGRCRIDLFVGDGMGELPVGEILPTEEAVRAAFGERLELYRVTHKRGARVEIEYRFEPGLKVVAGAAAGLLDAHRMSWKRHGLFGYAFEKRVSPARDLVPPEMAGIAERLGGTDLPGLRVRTIVHFPGRVVESDATTETAEQSSWDVSLGDLLGGGRTLHATVSTLPDPTKPLLWIGGILCLGALLVAGAMVGIVLVRGQRSYPGR